MDQDEEEEQKKMVRLADLITTHCRLNSVSAQLVVTVLAGLIASINNFLDLTADEKDNFYEDLKIMQKKLDQKKPTP
jgi:hypothetical protein